MGFYLRKSVSVGPLRFNLSKSGISLSAGVRGLRFGTGPRGNYVHAGRHGFYYRATLPSGTPRPTRPSPPAATAPDDTMTPIESGSVAAMVDSSSADLLAEMNQKRQRWRLWPWVFLLFVTLIGPTATLMQSSTDATGAITSLAYLAAWIVATWQAHRFDVMRKTTVLLYNLEDEPAAAYQTLHDAFDHLASCQGAWHLKSEGHVSDRKRHAGASTLVARNGITLAKRAPKWVETNIAVPAIPAGKETLHFFPDRLLVVTNTGVGAVGYASLRIDSSVTQFIENTSVPRDATVIGHRWQYVNKNGGPDKRFKNNRQLPIALYEEMRLTSASGLNEAIQMSRTGVAKPFGDTVAGMAALTIATPASTTSSAVI